jgi:hypothetical protein
MVSVVKLYPFLGSSFPICSCLTLQFNEPTVSKSKWTSLWNSLYFLALHLSVFWASCSQVPFNSVLHIVTYRGFYSQWKFISVPKTQHTTVKYNQLFSKHTSGVYSYTQRCSTQDSFYRTSSGNLPTRTHILSIRNSPDTRASLAISQY